MKPGDFRQVTVRAKPDAEGAVIEALERWFQQPPWSWTDADTGATDVAVCAFRKRDVSPARLRKITAELKPFAAGRIRVKQVRQQDWAESWKRHFKPIEIGATLLVKPSWSKRRPKTGQACVVLDPGLSFGTGQHPTTHFCLAELARAHKPDARQSFLDIGAGSGVLAIAAAKLGYAKVEAFDNDPEAVRIAKENAALNDVTGSLRLGRRDLTRPARRPPAKFDVICANLLADLLIDFRDIILRHLAPGGRLIVAGILKTQFAGVRRAYEAKGLRLVRAASEKEWRSGTLVRPGAH